MNNDKTAPGQSVREDDTELSLSTVYYTIKGKQDYLDENGNPAQEKENRYTYAKASGKRRMIRINDRGELMNPDGMYNDRAKMERWVPANELAFGFYLDFLRTRNQMYLRHTERNLK